MSAAEKINPQLLIKLIVQTGPHAGQSFHLSKPTFTIGRGPENEVVLINDAQMSRQHARLQVAGQDVEVINLSQKNKLFVGAESVEKWKLVNESVFKVGESEIKIFYDLGLSPQIEPIVAKAVSVVAKPVKKLTSTPSGPVAKSNTNAQAIVPMHKKSQPIQINQQQLQQQAYSQSSQQFYNQQPQNGQNYYQPQTPQQPSGLMSNPKFKFYSIFGLVLLGLVYWLMQPQKKAGKVEIKSTLKYEDEFLIKQNSIAEKDLQKKLKDQEAKQNNLTVQRATENFQKGMRDYQLGNYTRALDYFQAVLSYEPNHVQAKRHYYLSKIRFDEILKAKLILGESSYQKHNFKMCQGYYEQVLVMLQGKSNDQSYQIAQSMSEKCRLAQEGIR